MINYSTHRPPSCLPHGYRHYKHAFTILHQTQTVEKSRSYTTNTPIPSTRLMGMPSASSQLPAISLLQKYVVYCRLNNAGHLDSNQWLPCAQVRSRPRERQGGGVPWEQTYTPRRVEVPNDIAFYVVFMEDRVTSGLYVPTVLCSSCQRAHVLGQLCFRQDPRWVIHMDSAS